MNAAVEIGFMFADALMRDPGGFREGLAKALHDLTCNEDHDDPKVGPYSPEPGGMLLYQRRADELIALVSSTGVPADQDYQWAVENRVVREPLWALFRDRDDAERFVEDSIDLRVIDRKAAGAHDA